MCGKDSGALSSGVAKIITSLDSYTQGTSEKIRMLMRSLSDCTASI